MSRRSFIAQQIQDVLITTLLCESEEENFDCDSNGEYNPPLNTDSSNESDEDYSRNEKKTFQEISTTDTNQYKY